MSSTTNEAKTVKSSTGTGRSWTNKTSTRQSHDWSTALRRRTLRQLLPSHPCGRNMCWKDSTGVQAQLTLLGPPSTIQPPLNMCRPPKYRGAVGEEIAQGPRHRQPLQRLCIPPLSMSWVEGWSVCSKMALQPMERTPPALHDFGPCKPH